MKKTGIQEYIYSAGAVFADTSQLGKSKDTRKKILFTAAIFELVLIFGPAVEFPTSRNFTIGLYNLFMSCD